MELLWYLKQYQDFINRFVISNGNKISKIQSAIFSSSQLLIKVKWYGLTYCFFTNFKWVYTVVAFIMPPHTCITCALSLVWTGSHPQALCNFVITDRGLTVYWGWDDPCAQCSRTLAWVSGRLCLQTTAPLDCYLGQLGLLSVKDTQNLYLPNRVYCISTFVLLRNLAYLELLSDAVRLVLYLLSITINKRFKSR